MKTSSKIFSQLVFAFVITALFISCDESDDDFTTPSINDIEAKSANVDDITYADEVTDEVTDIADEAMELYSSQNSDLKSGGKFRYSRLNECVTVSKEITEVGQLTTIDFGDGSCEGKDRKIRSGKIIIEHTGSYWDSTQMRFTFENYFVDSNQVTGERNVIRTINANRLRIEYVHNECQVILADTSGTVTCISDYERTIVEGSETKTKRDDVISITGESNCTLGNGTVVSTTILEPLIRKNEPGCFMFIVSGVLETIIGEQAPIKIDFGDGTCDSLVEITQDGITEVVDLKTYRNCNSCNN